MPVSALLRRYLFGIAPKETTFERRGFRGGAGGVRQRLEEIGRVFAQGYHWALADDNFGWLTPKLGGVPRELQGFAYEGASMGLALRDCLTPWNQSRLQRFALGPGNPHLYMTYVGAGWILGRLPLNPEKYLQKEPLLGWLAIEGFGFHEGFFHWQRNIDGQAPPRKLKGYGKRVFDQGFGRCLWFINGGDADLIGESIARFSGERQGDLWSGVGLSTLYAGPAEAGVLDRMLRLAGAYRSHFCQGAAFAGKARQRAGNISSYTEFACQKVCGMSAEEAAAVTDWALENLPRDSAEPAFEVWRRRIQQRFATQESVKV